MRPSSQIFLSKQIKQLLIATFLLVLVGCATTNPTTTVLKPVKPKIGLALGGGAARGFAHVGVIQVLEEAGIKPDLVVGTSAGSVVAALYTSGKNSAQLLHIAQTMEESAFTDWMLPGFNRGVIKGEALAKYINAQVGGIPIEKMAIPLGVVATDLHSGEPILFRRGDTGTAVRASSAVPAVFQPVTIAGHEYVDGGLVSPVPVRFAKAMGADLVIAIDISSDPEGNTANSSTQILLQTFAIMGKSINSFEMKTAEVPVRPILPGVGSADFASRAKSIQAGRAAMLAALPQLKAKLAN